MKTLQFNLDLISVPLSCLKFILDKIILFAGLRLSMQFLFLDKDRGREFNFKY